MEIKDATIALLTDENGELNISKLIAPSEDLEEEETSEFKWKLQVADLSLSNVNAKLQSYKRKHSRANYKVIDLDDFRVNNINLSLSAFVDIKGNEFDITIHNFSANPNLYNFDLKNLSLKFLLVDDRAGVPYLNLITGNSQISLSAGLSNYKLLGEDKGRKIEDALMRLDFTADDFNFDKLSSFIEATDWLKGDVTIR